MKRHQLQKAVREALNLTFAEVGRATGLDAHTVQNTEDPSYNTTEGTVNKLLGFYRREHERQLKVLSKLQPELDRVGVGNGSAR